MTSPHVVRDGRRRLKFEAKVVASATSQRPGAVRWTELAIYALENEWIISKVGRSMVAHRPECPRVNWYMPRWLDAGEEAVIRRMPCVECRPVTGDEMDPHTRLEVQRYRAWVLRSPEEVVLSVTEARPVDRLPRLAAEVLSQLGSDPVLAEYVTSLGDRPDTGYRG